MAWFYTVLLAGGSVGILGWALLLTRRVFRDELLAGGTEAGTEPAAETASEDAR